MIRPRVGNRSEERLTAVLFLGMFVILASTLASLSTALMKKRETPTSLEPAIILTFESGPGDGIFRDGDGYLWLVCDGKRIREFKLEELQRKDSDTVAELRKRKLCSER